MRTRSAWRPGSLLLGFLFFSVVFYGHLYFFPFDEGTSFAPTWVRLIKDIVWLMVLAIFVWRFRGVFRLHGAFGVLSLLFFCWIAITALLGFLTSRNLSFMIETKNLLLFAPIIFMLPSATYLAFWDRFDGLFRLQALVFVATLLGLTLWLNGFSGTVGNPNTFAFLLNLYMVDLLARRSMSFRWKIIFFLSYEILLLATVSVSQLLLAGGVMILIPILRGDRRLWLFPMIFIVFAVPLFRHFPLRQLYTVRQACNRVIVDPCPLDPVFAIFRGPGSQDFQENIPTFSVTDRVQKFEYVRIFLREGTASEWLAGQARPDYFVVDGQFHSLLVNHGGMAVALFIAMLAWSALAGRRLEQDRRTVFYAFLLLSTGTFVFSRVLHYFPANVMIYAVWHGLSGEIGGRCHAGRGLTAVAPWRSPMAARIAHTNINMKRTFECSKFASVSPPIRNAICAAKVPHSRPRTQVSADVFRRRKFQFMKNPNTNR